MSFNDNVNLDSSRIEDRRGSGGGMGPGGKAGLGIGGVLVLLAAGWLGIDPNIVNGMLSTVNNGTSQQQQQQQQAPASGGAAECKTGSDANNRVDCRIVATSNSLDAFWPDYLKKNGAQYVPIKTVLFNNAVQTGCGTASSSVGPFYCPPDKKAYFDPGFFQDLVTKFGSSGGPLAQEYVVAHEYGHHIQNIIGTINNAQKDPQGPSSGGVRVELQADCFAGLWMKYASSTKDSSGTTFLQPLTQKDINDALSAAAAVGDDRIQKKATGNTNPESWTHGSSAQRQKWLTTGYQTGDFAQCNTFAVQQP